MKLLIIVVVYLRSYVFVNLWSSGVVDVCNIIVVTLDSEVV